VIQFEKQKAFTHFQGPLVGPFLFVGNGRPATTRLTESSRVKQPTSGNREQTLPWKRTFIAIL
jgi:hypothetical protein